MWKKGDKELQPKESGEDRFKRIATKRANRILDDFRLLGNCSNKSVYNYSDKQVKQIFSAIDKEYKRIKSQFEDHSKKRIRL